MSEIFEQAAAMAREQAEAVDVKPRTCKDCGSKVESPGFGSCPRCDRCIYAMAREQYPATAEGELRRQAAFAAERARQERDEERDGEPQYTQAELDEALRLETESAAHFYGTDEPVTAADVISADDIIRRLLALPGEIAAAEADIIKCESNVLAAKQILDEEEYAFLTGDNPPSGKNAETRAIQTKIALAPYRNTVDHHENSVRWARRDLTLKQNTFSALRAVARLLEGRE